VPKKREGERQEDLAMSEDAYKEFLIHKAKNITESSLVTYKRHLGMLIEMSRNIFRKDLFDLTKSEAMKLALKLSKEKKSAVTVGTLARMFYRYHDREDLAECFKIKRKRNRISPSEILTVEEVNKLIEATDNLRDRTVIAVLWETGARIHEILSLKMRNVGVAENGERTLYKVFFEKVKVEGQQHSCQLVEASSHITAWLKSYRLARMPDAPLFPAFNTLRHLSYNGFRDRLRGAIKKARLKKRIYPHLFRHSRATFLLRQGWSESMINKYMGWVQGSPMIGRYSHLADEDVDNKVLEMHGLEPAEPKEMPKLIEATMEAMSTTVPMPDLPIDLVAEQLDRMIEARVAEKWGDWTTQVETGELSDAMEERTETIRIAVKDAVKKVDKTAAVEYIELSFPERKLSKSMKRD
jgi:site-specific recombinase XerD